MKSRRWSCDTPRRTNAGLSLSLAIIKDDADNFYQMIENLGSGQFGEVLKARHRATGKVVAVKFIGLQHTDTQEMEIMLLLRHTNLVKLYEIYQTNTEIQLVMELLQGGDLFDRIKSQTKFAEEHTKVIVRQICEGVKYLHHHKIIHRDLKPENVLFVHPQDSEMSSQERWAIKIADFGRSKLFPKGVRSMRTETRCGTPGYAAPEMLLRQAYGEKIDCWGCGVLAYIMLSGYPPFPLDLAEESVHRVTTAQFKFPARHWINISEVAKDFISEILVANVDNRMSIDEALDHPWLKTSVAGVLAVSSTAVASYNSSTRSRRQSHDVSQLLQLAYHEHRRSEEAAPAAIEAVAVQVDVVALSEESNQASRIAELEALVHDREHRIAELEAAHEDVGTQLASMGVAHSSIHTHARSMNKAISSHASSIESLSQTKAKACCIVC